MSKPVKDMIMRTYREKFAGVQDAVLVDIRGIEANDNRGLRSDLASKEIRITVVKNHLARKVFSDTPLAPVNDLIEGPTAVVYGGQSVVQIARELIEHARKLTNLQFKGAIMEGAVFGAEDFDRLSKFPTREEAQAQVIQVILGPAGALISAATSAGGNITGIIKVIAEKLEKGETIEKVA